MAKNVMLSPNDYINLFENNKTIQLLIDISSRKIVYANQAACQFYQYSFEEMMMLSIEDINIMTTKEINKHMKKAFTEQNNYFSFHHRLKNQSIVAVDVISYPIELDGKSYLLSTITPTAKQINLLLTDVFYHSIDAIAILDRHYNIVAINHSFTKLFEYGEDQVIGGRLDNFVFPDNISIDIGQHYQDAFKGKIINNETIRRTKDNKLIYVRIIVIPYHLQNEIIGAQVVYQDISLKIQQEEELRLFQEIIKNNSDGVIITDSNEKIIWVNEAFEKTTGYVAEEVFNNKPSILKSNLQTEEFYNIMWEVITKTGEWQGEIWNRKKDGTVFPQWLQIFVINDQNGSAKNYVAIFKDLSQIDSVNKKMLMLLEKDALTSVYNRTSFMEKIRQMILYNPTRSYLLFIDLNGFKDLNDNYGHQIGDLVLVEFAKRLLIVFEKANIARYGGDEFVMFFNEFISKKELITLLEKLSHYLKNNFVIESKKLKFSITCSVGIAKYPEDGNNIDELLYHADKAMYYAKANGLEYAFHSEIKKNR